MLARTFHTASVAGRRILLALLCTLLVASVHIGAASAASGTPVPLLKKGEPVDWWFMFKLNSGIFPGCSGNALRVCLFGGSVQDYPKFGQQFVYASSDNRALKQGSGCAGDSVNDPLGATFDEVYNGGYHYLLWNDQFYDDPMASKGGPWGHSKGMLAWNDAGEGLVLQVTTPSWPAAGSSKHPRKHDGNTLGCVEDNDVLVSQHFFSLKLTKSDVVSVLKALANASVVTDPSAMQIVNNGGPSDIGNLVSSLGTRSDSTAVFKATLSSGVVLISKPSALHVPPWQMVSAELGGVDLRAATWWMNPAIYSTTAGTKLVCWDATLGDAGAVAIAESGSWNGKTFNLTGGSSGDRNHAKIGVSTSGAAHYSIFGDMNQQGSAVTSGKCASSQNGRGGLFYVINDQVLAAGVTDLIEGDTAPTKAPKTH